MVVSLFIINCFNPRLRMGGDAEQEHIYETDCVSIHASAWEATLAVLLDSHLLDVSIHASAWEATQLPL